MPPWQTLEMISNLPSFFIACWAGRKAQKNPQGVLRAPVVFERWSQIKSKGVNHLLTVLRGARTCVVQIAGNPARFCRIGFRAQAKPPLAACGDHSERGFKRADGLFGGRTRTSSSR